MPKNHNTLLQNYSSFCKVFIFVFISLCALSTYSQQELSSSQKFLLKNDYLHELQLEKFFLHTNKTTYYSGEKIWFKAYVVNDTDNKPSLQTTNLHINLYNADKKLFSNQLFFVENGTTNGEISLSKELVSGKYHIELTTQWNQNFKNNSAVFPIEIINTTQITNNIESTVVDTNTIAITESKENYAIKFYPESGFLLENVKNTIAFTVSKDSNPISIFGNIIDDTTGIIVAKLKSNNFGMGSFNLYCKPNRTYTAVIGTTKIKLPTAQSYGIIITENKKTDDAHNFIVKTNQKIISYESDNTIFAVLHRNGFPNTITPIQLNKNALNYSFSVLNSTLFKGVNTITLFNKSNESISEYSFFYHPEEKGILHVIKVDEEKDSLTLNFNLKNGFSESNLSVSLLPTNTKIYKNQSSIVTSFLLAPYLEKTDLNLTNFFESNYKKKDIDLLVKTSIKKNSFLYNKELEKIIHPENGMIIKGNVSSNVKDLTNYKVMLSSEENNILLIDSIGASNSFSFNNLLLKHPSKYKLALLNHQGEIINTGFRISHKLIQYTPNQQLEKEIRLLTKVTIIDEDPTTTSDNSLPLLFDDSTLLDVVNIKGYNKNRYKNKKETLKKLKIKKNVLENNFSQLYTIKEGQDHLSISEYLMRIPGIKISMLGPTQFTILNRRGKSSILGNTPMKVFVDGMLVDTEYIGMMRASDFIAISVNASGAGLGVTGQGGFVSFYTKNGASSKYRTITNTDIFISETEFGFSSATNYENHQMTFANRLSKEYYGTIGWFPNFIIKPNTANLLKFNKSGYKNVKVIINGMDTEGNLIFKVIDFNLKVN